MTEFPRVLILNSHSFDNYSGDGVMLKNLFKGWPISKIAVAHLQKPHPVTELCEKYYKIGYEEHHYVFPLDILSNEKPEKLEGPYSPEAFISNSSLSSSDGVVKSRNFLKKGFLKTIDKTGLSEFLRPFKMSKQFRRWVEDFKPDIIYSQLSSIGTINLVQQAYKISGARIVIHIMDDWPTTIYKDKYLGFLLQAILSKKFRNILGKASSCMAISDEMANEYEKRYGRKFLTFHNPVDIHGEVKVNLNSSARLKKIVYTGRIGRVNKESLIDFAKVVDEMDLAVEFYIYSADSADKTISSDFKEMRNTRLMSPVEHAQVLNVLRESDLLLLPLNFDRWARNFVRLSMPSKATDYLLSGTPILVYAPRECAVSIYARNEGWGYVVGSKDVALLKEALSKTLFDSTVRQELSQAALRVVSENHNSNIVREKFRLALHDAAFSAKH